MATSPPQHEWLVLVPDFPDALSKRLTVRPNHLENIIPEVKDGKIVFGGSYLSEVPAEGQTPPMIGSAMLIVAATKEDVLERVKRDVYTTGGVWDVDKVQIWPFRTAVRTAL